MHTFYEEDPAFPACRLFFLIPAVLSAEGKKKKLVWARWWDPEWGEDTVEWIVNSFEEKNPGVEVEPLFIPHDQFSDELLTQCQAGDCPDIMGMEVMWSDAVRSAGLAG